MSIDELCHVIDAMLERIRVRAGLAKLDYDPEQIARLVYLCGEHLELDELEVLHNAWSAFIDREIAAGVEYPPG